MPDGLAGWRHGTTLHPAAQHPPELLLAAQGIRWAIFDVDGVLTDGRLYIGEHGEQFKAFSTLDGHGLKLLALGGITPVVITGRDSPAVRRRVADLGIEHAVYGATDKLAAATQLMAQLAPGLGHAVRDGRRLAGPAAAGPRGIRLRAGKRAHRSEGACTPCHAGWRRLRSGARMLRLAVDGGGPLRGVVARPRGHAGRRPVSARVTARSSAPG